MAVIDLHCHVLPGIDDGPQTIEDALDLARAAAAAGRGRSWPPPTSARTIPTDAATIAGAVAELNARLADRGDRRSTCSAGAEIAVVARRELDPASSGAAPGRRPWLLSSARSPRSSTRFRSLFGAAPGARPPDRARPPRALPGFHRGPSPRSRSSPTGRPDLGHRRLALSAASVATSSASPRAWPAPAVHNVASDAHDCDRRPPAIADAARAGRARRTHRAAHRGHPRGDPRRDRRCPSTPAPSLDRRRRWRGAIRGGRVAAEPGQASLTTAITMPMTTRTTTSDLQPDPVHRHPAIIPVRRIPIGFRAFALDCGVHEVEPREIDEHYR